MYILFIGAELNVVTAEPAVRAAWSTFVESFKKKSRRNKGEGSRKYCKRQQRLSAESAEKQRKEKGKSV
jgi:hypothetical protein